MLMAFQPTRDLACSYKDKNSIEKLNTYLPGSINRKIQMTNNMYLHGSSSTLREKVPVYELNQGRSKSLPSRRRSGEGAISTGFIPAEVPWAPPGWSPTNRTK
jgi:hypothetical protein